MNRNITNWTYIIPCNHNHKRSRSNRLNRYFNRWSSIFDRMTSVRSKHYAVYSSSFRLWNGSRTMTSCYCVSDSRQHFFHRHIGAYTAAAVRWQMVFHSHHKTVDRIDCMFFVRIFSCTTTHLILSLCCAQVTDVCQFAQNECARRSCSKRREKNANNPRVKRLETKRQKKENKLKSLFIRASTSWKRFVTHAWFAFELNWKHFYHSPISGRLFLICFSFEKKCET